MKEGKTYKMFAISDFMAHTVARVFKVVSMQEDGTAVIILKNEKGNWERKKRLLSLTTETIVIEESKCVLRADSEKIPNSGNMMMATTHSFVGNACYNFRNTPDEIREQLKLNENPRFVLDSTINSVEGDTYTAVDKGWILDENFADEVNENLGLDRAEVK
jgi:hypothetical protein